MSGEATDLLGKILTAPAGGEDNYVTAHGQDLHSAGELGEDHDKFWDNLEIYTGKKFDGVHRERFGWSCTC